MSLKEIQEMSNSVKLAEMSYQPKISYSMLGAPIGHTYMGNTANFKNLQSFYQSFVPRYKNVGPMYAIEYYYTGRTDQGIYLSIDGGLTWTLLGTAIAVDIANGERLLQLFVDGDGTGGFYFYFLKQLTAAPTYAIVAYAFNVASNTFTLTGTLNLGAKSWLNPSSSIDNYYSGSNIIMFAEYGGDTETEFNVYKTTDHGANWTSVFTQTGRGDTGEIRHFHTCLVDPYTGYWWVSSGDDADESKVWMSEDQGATWTLQDSGTEDLRTCGFVFESDFIYYGMDTPSADTPTKIFKFAKNNLAGRTLLGLQPENCAIRAMTRMFFPPGIIFWPAIETTGVTGTYVTPQFYDFVTKKLYNLPKFPAMGQNTCGFTYAARYQDKFNGAIPLALYTYFADAFPFDISSLPAQTSCKNMKATISV